MTEALQVNGLRKSYGKNEVLKGVDLCVRRGDIFALLGVNGAGKTTWSCITVEAGFAKPDNVDCLLRRSAPVFRGYGRNFYVRYARKRPDFDSVHDSILRHHGCVDWIAALACGNIQERHKERIPGEWRTFVIRIIFDQYFGVCSSAHHELHPLCHCAGCL